MTKWDSRGYSGSQSAATLFRGADIEALLSYCIERF
jgi:hypothetical protein